MLRVTMVPGRHRVAVALRSLFALSAVAYIETVRRAENAEPRVQFDAGFGSTLRRPNQIRK